MAVAVTVARPEASVTAEAADRPAEAPEPGAAKFTATPETGLPPASLTSAVSAVPNPVEIAVLWLSPALTASVAAAPTVLVRPNV